MALIKLKTRMAGPDGVNHPGSVIDVADAKTLIDKGYAVSAEEQPQIKPKKKVK
jgi:hypothetical protein